MPSCGRSLVIAIGATLLVGACAAAPGPRGDTAASAPAAPPAGGAAAGATSPSASATFPTEAAAASAPGISPAPCPDLTAVPVSIEDLVAAGPTRVAECARAQGVAAVVFDAYFPAYDCGICGAEGPMTVSPGWLTGTYVAIDVHTGALAAYQGRDGWDGVRVTTGPVPTDLSPDDAFAWTEANGLTVRIPPALGACTTMSTRIDTCTYAPYTGRTLRLTTHLFDAAAATCAWSGPEGVPSPAPDDVRAYCERQLVVETVADAASPGVALPPVTSTE